MCNVVLVIAVMGSVVVASLVVVEVAVHHGREKLLVLGLRGLVDVDLGLKGFVQISGVVAMIWCGCGDGGVMGRGRGG